MYNLLASAAAFVLLHRAVSGSPVPGLLVGRIGELAYSALFQIASFVGLVWLAAAYASASLSAPSPRNLVLFGTLLAVALTGTVSIDAKRRRSLGPKWTAFASRTSNMPFAAILAVRQAVRLDELGWKSIIAVAALSAVLVLTHSFLFSVPAAG
jgi:uncharacterized membrane protein